MLTQSYTIPDAVPAALNLTLAFSYYIEDRGADALTPPNTLNQLRVKLVYAGGSTYQYEVNPTGTFRTPTGRWIRAQIVTPIPSGTSRSVQVLVEAFDGSNAAVFRVTEFRLSYGKRPDFNNDEAITMIKGGRIEASGTLTLAGLAGVGVRNICVGATGTICGSF